MIPNPYCRWSDSLFHPSIETLKLNHSPLLSRRVIDCPWTSCRNPSNVVWEFSASLEHLLKFVRLSLNNKLRKFDLLTSMWHMARTTHINFVTRRTFLMETTYIIPGHMYLCYISDNSILVNKKVFLRDRKRCTARGVANAKPGPFRRGGGYPSSVLVLSGERLPQTTVLSWFFRDGRGQESL